MQNIKQEQKSKEQNYFPKLSILMAPTQILMSPTKTIKINQQNIIHNKWTSCNSKIETQTTAESNLKKKVPAK